MLYQRKWHCKKREVWLANLSGSVGSEQTGTRPVLVLKVYSKEMVLVLPITSKNKGSIWYAPVRFGKNENAEQKESFVILSHVRSIHRSRLLRLKGRVDKDQFKLLHTATLQLM